MVNLFFFMAEIKAHAASAKFEVDLAEMAENQDIQFFFLKKTVTFQVLYRLIFWL